MKNLNNDVGFSVRMSALAWVRGRFVQWTPRAGLDPTFLHSHLRVGAMLYAFAKEQGRTEEDAQEAAEKGLYEAVYGCSYGTLK